MKLVPFEKWGQCWADWDCCPYKLTLDKQMCPAIGQVPAPEMLRQNLNAECAHRRHLGLPGKVASEEVILPKAVTEKATAYILSSIMLLMDLVTWEYKGEFFPSSLQGCLSGKLRIRALCHGQCQTCMAHLPSQLF